MNCLHYGFLFLLSFISFSFCCCHVRANIFVQCVDCRLKEEAMKANMCVSIQKSKWFLSISSLNFVIFVAAFFFELPKTGNIFSEYFNLRWMRKYNIVEFYSFFFSSFRLACVSGVRSSLANDKRSMWVIIFKAINSMGKNKRKLFTDTNRIEAHWIFWNAANKKKKK